MQKNKIGQSKPIKFAVHCRLQKHIPDTKQAPLPKVIGGIEISYYRANKVLGASIEHKTNSE